MRKINFLNRTMIFLVLAVIFLPTVWAQTAEMQTNEFYQLEPNYQISYQDDTLEFTFDDENAKVQPFDLRAYQCVAQDYSQQNFDGFGRNARAEALLGCESMSQGCRITKCGWL